MSNESLLMQLAHRAEDWHRNTNISQSAMAAAINMGEANYSGFLKGSRGISAEATCLLLKFINLSPRQAIMTFKKPVLSSQILQLQERGKRMEFSNDGWTPKEGNSAADPVDKTAIDKTDKAKTSTIADFLKVFAQLATRSFPRSSAPTGNGW
jgi:hypothetical protein